MKRTPMKRGTSTLKRSSGLKKGGKIKAKPKTEEQKAQEKEDTERMWQLFEEHWEKKSVYKGERYNVHICENCEDWILGENKSLYHDHLLEKSTYPEYKYDINNLFLCCWQCHSNKGNGNPGPKHKAAIEAAKIRYNIM